MNPFDPRSGHAELHSCGGHQQAHYYYHTPQPQQQQQQPVSYALHQPVLVYMPAGGASSPVQWVTGTPPIAHQHQPPPPPGVADLFRFKTLPPPLTYDDFVHMWRVNEAAVPDSGDEGDGGPRSHKGASLYAVRPGGGVGAEGAGSLGWDDACDDDRDRDMLSTYYELLARWHAQIRMITGRPEVRARLRILPGESCPGFAQANSALSEEERRAAAAHVARRAAREREQQRAAGGRATPGDAGVSEEVALEGALLAAALRKWSDLCASWCSDVNARGDEALTDEDDAVDDRVGSSDCESNGGGSAYDRQLLGGGGDGGPRPAWTLNV